MRKILYVLGGLVGVLVLAALIVPSFFDWNQYKPEIAAEVRKATGRDLTIGGDIGLTILPAPALTVSDVRLANLPGGSEPDMVRIKEVEVSVALLPLLGGNVQVSSIRLVEPQIALERLADGRANWEFTPAADGGTKTGTAAAQDAPAAPATTTKDAPAAPATASAPDDFGGAPAVRLDNVEIVHGTVSFRDDTSGTQERVTDLDATVRAASLQGPMESRGRATVRGVNATFDVAVGDLAKRATVPVRIKLADEAGSFTTEFSGHVSDAKTKPRVDGTIRADGDILATLIQTVSPQPLPGFLAQPFEVKGDLRASQDGAAVDALTVKLGETTASGTVSAEFNGTPALLVRLAVGRVNLDQWLSMPTVASPGSGDSGSAAGAAPAAPAGNTSASAGAPAPKAAAPAARGRATLVPQDIAADVDVAVEAIVIGGQPLQDVKLTAEVADGDITLSQLSALLPAGADAAVFGFLTAANGEPRFEGNVEARVPELPGLLQALGVDVSGTPAAGLRSLSAKSAVVATSVAIQTRNLDVQVDRSHITGSLGTTLTGKPRVTADLTIDRLNLDDLLAAAAPKGGGAAAAVRKRTAGGEPASDKAAGTPAKTPAAEKAPAASPLDAFDADVKLRVGTLTYESVSAGSVVLDGALSNGDITVRKASVGNLAKASANVSGTIIDPLERLRVQDVTFQASVPEPERLARLFNQTLPPEVLALGAIAAQGTVTGDPDAPKFDVKVNAAGASVSAAGTADLRQVVAGPPPFKGHIGVQSKNIGTLIGALAPDARPAGPLGVTDVSAQVDSAPGTVKLANIQGVLTGFAVQGSLRVDYGAQRPSVIANLATGDVVVDRLLPAKRASALPWRMVPAAWAPPRVPALTRSPYMLPIAINARWSRAPIDVSALRQYDADIKLRSKSIRYQEYALTRADIAAKLAGGVLTLSKVDGALFGGPLQATGVIDATQALSVRVDAAVKDADLAQAGSGAGRASMTIAATARGASEAELISSLNGNGKLVVRGLSTDTDPTAFPIIGPLLSGVLGPTQILDKSLGGILGAMGSGSETGTLGAQSTFVMSNGVVRTEDATFAAPTYKGNAAGFVDLPAWNMDVKGTVELSGNLLGTLLKGVKEVPQQIPFRAYGSPDHPKVEINVGFLSALPIPGLDKLEKAVPGAGKVIEKILPGLGGGAAPKSGSETKQQAPAQTREKAIENTIKGLFR